MKLDARPVLERGVRLHATKDGVTMLLVPEGALTLNTSAAAALGLVDGQRTIDEIVGEICERFDVPVTRARDEIGTLFERLRLRRMLVLL